MSAPYHSMRIVEPNSNFSNSRESAASVWIQKRPTAFHHNIFQMIIKVLSFNQPSTTEYLKLAHAQ